MECIVEQQQVHEQIMEAPEIDGAELLVELLDASKAAEEEEVIAAGRSNQQLGFPADDGWHGSLLQEELNSSIHPHLPEEEGCEDCGLDGILQSGFEGCQCSASPAPYFVDGDNVNDPVEHWTEEMALGSFDGECVGEWYMDGMDMEWDDGRSYYSFYYPSYGGEACTEQFYSSPLWE